ncbi:G-protein coupled receptor isoform X2 [Biomphalaria glabrata]|nr:G-protein coupled receptor isoform X2 [Biomphalaria glabrata]
MSVTILYSNVSSRLDITLPEMNLTSGLGVPDNGTDDEKRRIYESYTLYTVTYAMATYYLYVIAAFGVPGNVASIFTIITLPTVSSSKVHVAILAVTDTMAIVLKLLYQEFSARGLYVSLPFHTIIFFLMEFFTTYANWVVVAMTAERFLAVCFPLRVGRMYTRRKAIVVLAGLALITASINIFHFWAWEELCEDGFWYYKLKDEYIDVVHGAFYYITGTHSILLPCALIFTGNALIILSIRQARAVQRHLTNSVEQGGRKAKDQRQITVMLVVVSIVFLLLNTPNAFLYFFKKYWEYELWSYSHAEYFFTARFIHLLLDANHAVNFYLYFLSMSSFRRRFLDSIRCRGKIRHRHTMSSVYRTSQTYINSLHQTGGGDTFGRPDGLVYSAFSKRNSSSRAESGQSIKLTTNGVRNSNNNKITRSLLKNDSQHFVTANSDL